MIPPCGGLHVCEIHRGVGGSAGCVESCVETHELWSAASRERIRREEQARALVDEGEPWWMNLNRMPSIIEQCMDIPQIAWEMQAACEPYPFQHCVEVLNRHVGNWRRFKIGHTHVPLQRWHRFKRDKQYVKKLVFAFVGEDVDESSKLEEQLVDEYWGDPRFLNIRRAGDRDYTDFGFSPFFVYISFE